MQEDILNDPRFWAYLNQLAESRLTMLINLDTGKGLVVKQTGGEPPAVEKLSDKNTKEAR